MDPTRQGGSDGAIAKLAKLTGRSWAGLAACAAAAREQRSKIATALDKEKLIPADCSFVTFGSLARDEYTQGSDIDWTLLVDGQADPQHLPISQRIDSVLAEVGGTPPGPTALFGSLTFSHELIHLIGGDADTNRNTTRRILLLLESRRLHEDDGVRDRVRRSVFNRYLEEDIDYHAQHAWRVRVPRFLLNDIVRFWRTMTVDYAAKRRERAGRGWAIRNFKLRLSRKLIFVAGLAMCLSCELRPSQALKDIKPEAERRSFYHALEEFLLEFSNRTPLEVIGRFGLEFDAADTTAVIFDRYDEFLTILQDANTRKRLEEMDLDKALTDPSFQEARRIGNAFQDGLTKLFFSTDDDLARATQRYGVF